MKVRVPASIFASQNAPRWRSASVDYRSKATELEAPQYHGMNAERFTHQYVTADDDQVGEGVEQRHVVEEAADEVCRGVAAAQGTQQ